MEVRIESAFRIGLDLIDVGGNQLHEVSGLKGVWGHVSLTWPQSEVVVWVIPNRGQCRIPSTA